MAQIAKTAPLQGAAARGVAVRAPSAVSALKASKAAPRSERAPTVAAVAAEVSKVAVTKTDRPMNIVFVSAEVSPWSKTGGLGDVVGALPIALAARGHKVMSVSPRYDQYKGAWDTSIQAEVLGEEVRFFHETKKGVDRVFVDHPMFLAKVMGKTGSKLYGGKTGADYLDNQKRFATLCMAAFSACTDLPFGYGEEVCFVANDWHTSLVPVLLKAKFQPEGRFLGAKCAICCHNIAFQGRFKPTNLTAFGVPEDAAPAFAFADGIPPGGKKEGEKPTGEIFEKINWLQAGFAFSDKNLTVSPNYAEEISGDEEKGVELNGMINASGGIEGIVNGMDTVEWNPLTDKYLDVPYDKDSVVEGKAAAKMALQAEVGLDVSPSAPLFGYIGRLEEQKGVDIMLAAIPKLIAKCPNAQVVVLGTGKKKMEAAVEALENKCPAAKGVVKFSTPVAHLITAGADFLLVPSRFEPCGLIQLHAMRYGTVPVVASTGGLVDTVLEGKTGFHIGAMDPDELVTEDVDAVVATCAAAAAVYGTPAYTAMSSACIKQDLGWAKPAEKWEAVLEALFEETAASVSKKTGVLTPKVVAERELVAA